MSPRRLRMVAGPNGSGKTTLLNVLRTKFHLGHVLNPDDIERTIHFTGSIDLGAYGITVDLSSLREFLERHPIGGAQLAGVVDVRDGHLFVPPALGGGYAAAMICDFMRRQWLAKGESFTFETVMSGPDKVMLLREAAASGYRTYLYYICTDDPIINRNRVASRVQLGGHDVPSDKIESRYRRSLLLLKSAVEQSSRAFLFDNSGESYRLLAEFEAGRLTRAAENLSPWFVRSMLTTT
jgi:predicted ABC-type ATPase